jgi:hypothetical protein
VRIDMRRALLACLLALMIVPAAAGAAYQVGDSPHAISVANGPRPPAPLPPAASTPRVITTHEGSPTVAVVLAALALSVAIAGTGYVTLRIRPLLRS